MFGMPSLDKLERISRLVSPPEPWSGEAWPLHILRRIQRKAARR